MAHLVVYSALALGEPRACHVEPDLHPARGSRIYAGLKSLRGKLGALLQIVHVPEAVH